MPPYSPYIATSNIPPNNKVNTNYNIQCFKKEFSPLAAGSYGKSTKRSILRCHQGNEGKCGLEPKRVRALGTVRSVCHRTRKDTSILRNKGEPARRVWKDLRYGMAETLKDVEEGVTWWRYMSVWSGCRLRCCDFGCHGVVLLIRSCPRGGYNHSMRFRWSIRAWGMIRGWQRDCIYRECCWRWRIFFSSLFICSLV
jgi:hypothetical protein